jgi:hypothetical protein
MGDGVYMVPAMVHQSARNTEEVADTVTSAARIGFPASEHTADRHAALRSGPALEVALTLWSQHLGGLASRLDQTAQALRHSASATTAADVSGARMVEHAVDELDGGPR